MKTLQLLKRLEAYPLFTQNDVSKLVNKSSKYIKTLLSRLFKQGIIKRVERGKYSVHDDPMIFASYIATPSYLGLWTAIRHYNMTQQQPSSLFVLSPVKRKSITFQNIEIIFIKTCQMFGYNKERYFDFDIFISDREKTIIDSLLFKIPIEDVSKALENEEISFEKLADYAKKAKNKSLIKRLGYLLERNNKQTFGLKPLDNNYVLLDYLSKKRGKKDKKWNVAVNI